MDREKSGDSLAQKNPAGRPGVEKLGRNERLIKLPYNTFNEKSQENSNRSENLKKIQGEVSRRIDKARQKFASRFCDWENPFDLIGVLDEEPEPIRWFIRDRIVQSRGVLVCGVGGSSKTRLIYHLAVGASLGHLPWAWEVETKGRSVLVLTEDTEKDFNRTIHNHCLSHELSQFQKELVYRSMIVYPVAGKDTRLLIKSTRGSAEKSDLFWKLRDKIVSLKNVVFVGLDPALSLTEGDELDQGDQRALGKMADDLAVETGATVALVAHASKASLSKAELSSHNSRGGGALTDAVRSEFVLRTMTADEARKAGLESEARFRHVQLVATKGNYLPPSAYLQTWLIRDDFGMLKAAEISFSGENKEPDAKDLQALEALKELPQNSTLGDWRAACVDAGIIGPGKKEAQEKQMERIKNSLKEYGHITNGIKRGVWLVREEKSLYDFNP